jgi:hypothetical protein
MVTVEYCLQVPKPSIAPVSRSKDSTFSGAGAASSAARPSSSSSSASVPKGTASSSGGGGRNAREGTAGSAVDPGVAQEARTAGAGVGVEMYKQVGNAIQGYKQRQLEKEAQDKMRREEQEKEAQDKMRREEQDTTRVAVEAQRPKQVSQANASNHADTLLSAVSQCLRECPRTTPVAGGSGSGEGESGQEREKAEQAANRVSKDQMDSAERRASARKHKVVKRFVEEVEVQKNARKKAKQGTHKPCGVGQGGKGEVVDVGQLSLEQAAAKLVGIVTILKFFPRHGFFNGLITSFDATTKKFQVEAFGVGFPAVDACRLPYIFSTVCKRRNRSKSSGVVWCGLFGVIKMHFLESGGCMCVCQCCEIASQNLVNMSRCATMTAMRRRCCWKSWALYSPRVTRTQVKPAFSAHGANGATT